MRRFTVPNSFRLPCFHIYGERLSIAAKEHLLCQFSDLDWSKEVGDLRGKKITETARNGGRLKGEKDRQCESEMEERMCLRCT